MSEEKLAFQAEVSRLLEIVAGALYSDKEVFLRELISNASDACDRLRYAALTQPGLTAGDADLKITVTADPEAGTLTLSDNGIGMNRDDLVENLGTIARSGTAAFMAGLKQAAESKEGAVNLIGQFGVGFYSAFMVAEHVTVETRKAGEEQGWRWESDGKGGFTVAESETAPARGAVITLQLKEDAKEFCDPRRLEGVVRAYSDHIAVPILLAEKADEEPRQLNQASALWTRPKSEISEEQYREFYHHAAHAFDEPWARLHFQVEGMLSYGGLLYVPSQPPLDLFHPERKQAVRLYVKRVFITDESDELLPAYLRFLRGVVDCEDLPLNVSREMLQNSPVLAKIRSGLTKRVLDLLEERAKDPEGKYEDFWSAFGPVLKEGIYEDGANRERLLTLARFRSSKAEGWISLADYLGRMAEGQQAIYFLSGDELARLKQSPQLEGYAAKGIEVLFLTDPVDDFWLSMAADFQGKPFKSVTRGSADLESLKKDEAGEEEKKEESEVPEGFDALAAFVKLSLGDKVKDVRASKRLTTSPVCLVADEGDMDLHLERLLRQHQQLQQESKRILELNPSHPLIQALSSRCAQSEEAGAGKEVEEAAWLLLDQARILEGEALPDPAAFARRLNEAMTRGLLG
jgi:molecular chaperone HtpG